MIGDCSDDSKRVDGKIKCEVGSKCVGYIVFTCYPTLSNICLAGQRIRELEFHGDSQIAWAQVYEVGNLESSTRYQGGPVWFTDVTLDVMFFYMNSTVVHAIKFQPLKPGVYHARITMSDDAVYYPPCDVTATTLDQCLLGRASFTFDIEATATAPSADTASDANPNSPDTTSTMD